MTIDNDEELVRVVVEVSENLQAIQDYLGQEPRADGKIRFPRGFMRTAGYFRQKLLFMRDRSSRDNLTYAFILSDVYRWLTNRTDIYGTARDMVVKAGLVLAGSIAETIIIDYTTGVVGKKRGFCARADRMVSLGMISNHLAEELKWLWGMRRGIHIYEIKEREYKSYSLAQYNRAVSALHSLRQELALHHGGHN